LQSNQQMIGDHFVEREDPGGGVAFSSVRTSGYLKSGRRTIAVRDTASPVASVTISPRRNVSFDAGPGLAPASGTARSARHAAKSSSVIGRVDRGGGCGEEAGTGVREGTLAGVGGRDSSAVGWPEAGALGMGSLAERSSPFRPRLISHTAMPKKRRPNVKRIRFGFIRGVVGSGAGADPCDENAGGPGWGGLTTVQRRRMGGGDLLRRIVQSPLGGFRI